VIHLVSWKVGWKWQLPLSSSCYLYVWRLNQFIRAWYSASKSNVCLCCYCCCEMVFLLRWISNNGRNEWRRYHVLHRFGLSVWSLYHV